MSKETNLGSTSEFVKVDSCSVNVSPADVPEINDCRVDIEKENDGCDDSRVISDAGKAELSQKSVLVSASAFVGVDLCGVDGEDNSERGMKTNDVNFLVDDGGNVIEDAEIVAVSTSVGESTASEIVMEPITDVSNKVKNIDKQKKTCFQICCS